MDKRLLCLPAPSSTSHKGQNGVVLVIGGGRTYHGAPILASLAAVRFCDLVYFASTDSNDELLRKMRLASPNIIGVPKNKFSFALSHCTCVLVGNGMEVNASTGKMLGRVLKTKKRCVLDAAALRVLPLGLLHRNCILTPHAGEFKAAFGGEATAANASAMAKKYGCTILLKGKKDFVAGAGKGAFVAGGNAGMTKGGTGDVLAGLAAALFSRCTSPLKAAYTASAINKKAGEGCFKKLGYNFSSEDLAEELALAAKGLYKAQKTVYKAQKRL